jgi:hypothetical protein
VSVVGLEALRQTEVGPRASGDRRLGSNDQLGLGGIEVHRVSEEEMTPEHPEPVEVDDRAHTDAIEIALRVSTVRGNVHRHPGSTLPRQIRCPGHEGIGHEIVSDQRHPALDEAACWEEIEHLALPIEHLLGRRGVGRVVDIPPPATDAGAQSDVP